MAVAAVLLMGVVVSTVFALRADRAAKRADAEAVAALTEKERADEQARAAEEAKLRADEQATKATAEAQRAETEATEAKRQKEVAEDTLYRSQIRTADLTFEVGRISEAFATLNQVPWDRRRTWEYRHLQNRFHDSHLTLRGHTYSVNSVTFSPDGSRIASGSEDKTVKVWDARTGQVTLTLRGHTGAVLSVAFSPDGSRLMSRDEIGTVIVWDARTGQPVQEPPPVQPNNAITAADPEGHLVARADGNVIRIEDRRLPRHPFLADEPIRQFHNRAWHRTSAPEAEDAADWHRAAYHLGWLLADNPADASLHRR